MKLRNLNIFLLCATLTALLSLSACVDDYLYKSVKGKLEPGTPVELTLGLQIPETQDAVIGSRASTETETDRTVYDLYLFIFNQETNKLKAKYYFSQLSSKAEISCDPAYSTTGSAVIKRDLDNDGKASRIAGRIQHIHTTAGPSRIVAVANCNRKGSAMILDRLNSVETVQDLRSIMVSTIDPASKLPDFEQSLTVMSGYYCDNDDNHNANHLMTPCDFVNDESDTNSHKGYVDIDTDQLPGTVWLTPLQSRVKFLVLSECPGKTDGIPAGKFELDSWQVYNLPRRTPLFCRGYGEDSEPLQPRPINSLVITRFDTDDEVVKDELPKTEKYDGIAGFNFFMADNHPGKGDPEKIKEYGDRAKWTGADYTTPTPPEEKEYTNAPAGATYVVLRGTYTGASYVTDADGTRSLKNVSGDVTYTIFLGHDSGSGDKADNTDFNTYRNYNYTYIVRVNGVDKITVEVNKEEEERPDAEGNIITTTSNNVTLDAHYEQRVISIKKQNVIDAIKGGNFQVSVTVPLFRVNRLVYKYDPENPNADEKNALPYMEWLEFYEHKPEEANRKYIYYTDARGNGKEKKTLNVKQFMQRLYEYANDANAPDELTFTVFFDEYLYTTDPGNGNPVIWQDLLRNGQARRFTMLGTTKFSDDHNSSYTTSGTTFVQRCMQTIYDVDMAGLERGWATEVIEEDILEAGIAGIPYGTYSKMPSYQGDNGKGNGSFDESKFGRQNCWRVNAGPVDDLWEFKKLINQDGYLTKPTNKGANCLKNETNLFSACMQRNRDLNGNGMIDREEFVWYVPSLEQMQLLYIGYGALTDDVKLYDPQRERQAGNVDLISKVYKLRHYLTSSNNKKVWAEEGISYSLLGLDANKGTWNYDPVLYVRCARSLGTSGEQDNGIPWHIQEKPEYQFQSIYEYDQYPRTVDEVDGGEITSYKNHKRGRITMRYLNPQSLINVPRFTETPGLVHSFSENNFPTYQFEIADTLIAISGTNMPVSNDKNQLETVFTSLKNEADFSPCNLIGPGWRMPTITELAIIEWAWNENWKDNNKIYLDFINNPKYAGYIYTDDKNKEKYLNDDAKWRAFAGFFQDAALISRSEFYYKYVNGGLQPPHGGGVRTFHVFDKQGTTCQFTLFKVGFGGQATRVPSIRCVRSYSSNQDDESTNNAPARRAASQRRLRKK